MLETDLTYIVKLNAWINGNSLIDLPGLQIYGWKWSIILWILALHGIIAMILTELMGRTYGKSLLWFIIAFFLPIIGPISIGLYHLTLSTTATEARRQSFWGRMLFSGPVSLCRILIKEKARAEEVKLIPINLNNKRIMAQPDSDIERLLKECRYGDARAHAWKMMEIARELGDSSKEGKYQDYLEIIAEQQSINSSTDTMTTSEH